MSLVNIDLTPELTQLMKFAGDTATAIRMYSKYSGSMPTSGGQRRDPVMAPVDIMFLSDAISQLLNIGGAIERGNPVQIVDTCHSVQKLFESYATDNPSFDPQAKTTFDFWQGLVDLNVAVKALKGIQHKVTSVSALTMNTKDGLRIAGHLQNGGIQINVGRGQRICGGDFIEK